MDRNNNVIFKHLIDELHLLRDHGIDIEINSKFIGN
jgi:hypothetical protein